jgi:hypothetical protein
MDLVSVPKVRLVSEIANEISANWKNVNYAAKPYLSAMRQLYSVDDKYGVDTGKSIVSYFLSNASGFRGEKAKELKAELKKMYKL